MTAPTGTPLNNWLRILGYQAVGFAMMMTTAIIAAKAMPPVVYGEYWLLVSVVQVTCGIGLSWVAQSVLLFARMEARATGDLRSTLVTALALQAAILIPLLIVGWFCRPLLSAIVDLSPSTFVLIGLTVALMGAFDTFAHALQATHRFDGLGVGAALTKAGPLLAVAIILAGTPARADILLAGLAAGFAAALGVTARALPKPTGTGAAPSRWETRRFIRYGSPLALAVSAIMLSTWMHIWFVRAYGGPIEAGLYGWAASVHALVAALLLPISAVVTPFLTDLVLDTNRDAARRHIDSTVALVVLMAAAMPAIFGLLKLATEAMPETYQGAGVIFIIMMASAPAQMLFYLLVPYVRAHPEAIGRLVRIHLLTLFANLALSLVLTRHFGGVGAALTVSLAAWFCGGALYRLASQLIQPERAHHPMGGAGFTVLAGAVLGFAAMSAPWSPIMTALAGLVISIAGIVSARSFGYLRPLVRFTQFASVLPMGSSQLAHSFLRWCDNNA